MAEGIQMTELKRQKGCDGSKIILTQTEERRYILSL